MIAAALLAAILIVLLIVGGEPRQLRGAAVAARAGRRDRARAARLALTGTEYGYIEPALPIPAWPPIGIVVAAACTTRRLRIPGAVLATILLAVFAYGLVRISTEARHQRPTGAASRRRSAGEEPLARDRRL